MKYSAPFYCHSKMLQRNKLSRRRIQPSTSLELDPARPSSGTSTCVGIVFRGGYDIMTKATAQLFFRAVALFVCTDESSDGIFADIAV